MPALPLILDETDDTTLSVTLRVGDVTADLGAITATAHTWHLALSDLLRCTAFAVECHRERIDMTDLSTTVPSTPPPSVGRVVHYVAHGTPIRDDGSQAYPSVCRTADITEVGAWLDTDVQDHGDGTRSVLQTWHPEACSLFVKNPTGVFLSTGPNACRHDEAKAPGTWHWPERV